MPKHLKDYLDDEDKGKDLTTSLMPNIFPNIIWEKPQEILLDREEFKVFIYYLSSKFPWDWDGTKFMGIKLTKVDHV